MITAATCWVGGTQKTNQEIEDLSTVMPDTPDNGSDWAEAGLSTGSMSDTLSSYSVLLRSEREFDVCS